MFRTNNGENGTYCITASDQLCYSVKAGVPYLLGFFTVRVNAKMRIT